MMDVERVEVIVRAAMKLHNLCIDHRLGVGDSFDYGVLSTDFTGATDAVCRRVGERLQHESSVFVGAPRAAVDLARHLTSGTRDEETGAPTDESPETAWYDDDIPTPHRIPIGCACIQEIARAQWRTPRCARDHPRS